MKTKKALAVVLAVVMLVLPLAVSSLAASAISIVSDPIKTTYNDSEHFNPQGLTVNVDGVDVVYSPADEKFRFDPALNELLTVETTEVFVYYDNVIAGTVTITVGHIIDEKLTAIDNGHGQYCLGCGSLHNFTEHNVPEWIPNDDGGIFVLQTETGYCSDCGAEVTRTIPGSSSFDSLFDVENGSELEITVLSVMRIVLLSLVQMLTGIS